MPIIVVGLNHKTASVDLRGKIAFAETHLKQALGDFCHQTGATEVMILSTCNRVEIYCSGASPNEVITWLCTYHQVDHHELNPYLYAYQGVSALEHAMKVACSLDSMVIGEPQILGQLKQAYAIGLDANTVNRNLHHAFQQVFAAAKQVRTETMIGHCPVSVAHSAIQLAREQFSDLSLAKVAVIGAGTTAKLLLKHLAGFNLKHLWVINRSLDKAEALVANSKAQAFTLNALPHLLGQLDIILTATASPTPLITATLISQAKRAPERPLYLIDLSSPRNVEAQVSELPQVHLSCIDDIQSIVKHHSLKRSEATLKAEEIIHEHVMDYIKSLESRNAASVIRALRNKTQELCEQELNKSLKQLAQGISPERVLRQFAHATSNKWNHHPCLYLNQVGNESEVLNLVQRLFSLPET